MAVAASFLGCIERAGAECRPAAAPYRAWAAVRLLGFLRDGSPVSVIDRVGSSIKSTRDDDPARRALIAELTALDPDVHDGQCQAQGVRRLDAAGVDPLAAAAMRRAEALGLLASEIGRELRGLPAIAAPLAHGRVVEAFCARTARRFFLVLASGEGSFRVVSAQGTPPGLGPPGRPARTPSLPVPDDVVTPYIPVAEESL